VRRIYLYLLQRSDHTLSALDLYKELAEPHTKRDAAEMFSKLTDPQPTNQH